ncbi:MAG TPA: glucose 1-dehydrogenase [Syntrophomonas sp.]|nr:glucose 1-dehydrogenase [Syntrophomonas sp.]
MGKLDGKVAIITGAASGMGVRHAERFVEEGAKVVLADIATEDGQKLADKLGANAKFFTMDVACSDKWNEIVKFTETTFGPIDVLVNNAGIGIFKLMDDLTEADFKKTMDVNALSIFLSLKAVVPSMKKAGGGSIVNISSVDGLRGAATATAYCASKFAVDGITKCAAIELGTAKIRVNTVNPGIIKTPMAEQGEIAEIIAELEQGVPMKRAGTTDEASNLVIFLASDDSTYCTGAEFVIDGGMICDL